MGRIPSRWGTARLVCVAVALSAAGLSRAYGQTAATIAEQPVYVCPMHPEVAVYEATARCPKCGMALVKADPVEADYAVEVETLPAAPRAGETMRLRFTVRHPTSGAVVRNFATVHEKPFHLFVISQDMEDYQHIHPEPQPDGSLVVELTLPRAGYYKLYADFLPVGGRPQVVPQVLVTSDVKGDLASSRARLAPDTTWRKSAGSLVTTLELPPAGLIAGRDEKIRFHIADAGSGRPVADLEPYLGAWGHTLVMSEDTLHYVHAHPVEQLPVDAAAGKVAGGGPDLTFMALLPRPGRYRLWTQLKRGGAVSTVAFTVDVASPAALSAAR